MDPEEFYGVLRDFSEDKSKIQPGNKEKFPDNKNDQSMEQLAFRNYECSTTGGLQEMIE